MISLPVVWGKTRYSPLTMSIIKNIGRSTTELEQCRLNAMSRQPELHLLHQNTILSSNDIHIYRNAGMLKGPQVDVATATNSAATTGEVRYAPDYFFEGRLATPRLACSWS